MDSLARTLFGVGWKCPPGYEPDPVIGYGLCYENCPVGYKGISFLCWPGCDRDSQGNIFENGWSDIGLFCHKNSYHRGYGTNKVSCPSDHPDFHGGLCYKRCAPMNGVNTSPAYPTNPTTCVADCPPGTTDGAKDLWLYTCNKKVGSEYGRGAPSQGIGCPPGYIKFPFHCWKPLFDYANFLCPGVDANYNPVNGGKCVYGPANGFDGKDGRPCSYWFNQDVTSPCYNVPNPDRNNPKDPFYNTVLNPRNQNTCEENLLTMCYKKCDVNYHSVGLICSVDCKGMTDMGAYCSNRPYYYRGEGVGGNSCPDPEQTLENNTCRATCKDGFEGYNNYCTKTGCPQGTTELPFGFCAKNSRLRKTTQGAPPITGLLNYKFNLGSVGNLMRTVFFNVAFAVGVFFIIFGLSAIMSMKAKSNPLPPLSKKHHSISSTVK